jgi:hypothetical protein
MVPKFWVRLLRVYLYIYALGSKSVVGSLPGGGGGAKYSILQCK